MGKRGPKPRFLDVACPNEQCNLFGIAGKGNVTVYGTYTISSGKVRKYVCHTCGTDSAIELTLHSMTQEQTKKKSSWL